MAVLKIAKSGGVRVLQQSKTRVVLTKVSRFEQVVELDAAYRERVHKYQIHTYFYGHVIEPPYGISSKGYVQAGEQTPDQTMHLSPLSTSVNFGDIVIYRIGEGQSATRSL